MKLETYMAMLKTAWTWIKKWWWAVLLFPITLVVWSFLKLKEASELEGALRDNLDLEEKRNQRAIAVEGELEDTILKLEEAEAEKQEELTESMEESVAELQEDPEKLRDAMIQAGPGEKP